MSKAWTTMTEGKVRVGRSANGIVRRFRVYVEQVNQACVEVLACSPSEAEEKGYAKWRREDAHSRVSYVKEMANDAVCINNKENA